MTGPRNPDHRPAIRLAPAKLNLTLAVLGRRPDGFHDLHSLMVPLELHDRLSLAPAAGDSDSLTVALSPALRPDAEALGPAEANLVLRAIAVARQAVGRSAAARPLAVRLEKLIPVAAGLGGGSSDAAAALDGALEAWSADLPAHERLELAARLGSDVPFFLAGGAALIEGRGERVSPVRGFIGEPPGVLLVKPAIAVSTPAVFAALDAGGPAAPSDPRSTRMTSDHLASELETGLRAVDLVARAGVLAVANDLGNAAAVVAPELKSIRRQVGRVLGVPVGLSGSGPTLWALYPSKARAEEAAAQVSAAVAAGSIDSIGDAPPLVMATAISTPAGAESQPLSHRQEAFPKGGPADDPSGDHDIRRPERDRALQPGHLDP
ncbi:MAG TPA: 4-(cytidine 5'-diphospho)-2-C-methyl-D-erythritol kinase [Candidatus Eisenbacteria bacterium]|nr:4-(cytidine 5'-diphospho)-2-C-methyl-D-erythritol kinase [Candidatus Eisenbacteria bacterium]